MCGVYDMILWGVKGSQVVGCGPWVGHLVAAIHTPIHHSRMYFIIICLFCFPFAVAELSYVKYAFHQLHQIPASAMYTH
jgi:hypothetical protein